MVPFPILRTLGEISLSERAAAGTRHVAQAKERAEEPEGRQEQKEEERGGKSQERLEKAVERQKAPVKGGGTDALASMEAVRAVART